MHKCTSWVPCSVQRAHSRPVGSLQALTSRSSPWWHLLEQAKASPINTLFPQGRQGNHGERRRLVRESLQQGHGVRGVCRANPAAEKMLKYLDPYPMALEIKGGMRPAMYETVIITSNTRPDGWYKDEEAGGKRTDALLALWDRLGFKNGNNTICRTCGTYLEPALYGAITKPWLDHTRNWFMQQLMGACGIAAHDVLTDEEISDSDSDV